MGQLNEIAWLVMTIVMTALFSIPYVLHTLSVKGADEAMNNQPIDNKGLAQWAIRAKAAHYNAIENLVLFAPLVIISFITVPGNSMIGEAAMVYFFARLTHYLSYTLGIGLVRGLSFGVGLAATLTIAWQIVSTILL